jgi:intein/homing endonuclease
MVRELERPQSKTKFPETAPTAYPVFYRTYSRRTPDGKETWKEVCDRTIGGLKKLGKLTDEEADLLYRMQGQLKALSSGRWLWVGGTEWIERQENFSGAYNCSSTNVIDWETFGLLMDLAMMGCGTGAVIESRYINKLPKIANNLKVLLVGEMGTTPKDKRREYSEVKVEKENKATIYVGDSRQGWVGSYQALLELSTDDRLNGEVEVAIDLSDVRPAGEPLKGFGGVANPVRLPFLYQRCAEIVNKAVGRQLNSLECCLLIDEAAACIVAGNIRRCIAGGTLVAAIDGMKPIEEIKVGDRVLTSSGDYRPVVNKFVQGTQEVVQIRTPATSIRCTANHRVAVYNGLRSYTWKQAGQLQPGDRLISVPHERGSDSVNIDYAWVLGFLWKSLVEASVPSVTKSRKATATFSLPKRRLQSKLGEKCLAVLKLIGDTPTVSYNGNRGYIRIYRSQHLFASDFVESQEPNGDRQIPQSIWQGTAEIRASFLAGLSDADGLPARNILLHSNELDFLRQVQKLALSLGIATVLSERTPQELKRPQGNKKLSAGDHLIRIMGMQSEAIAFALVNQFAARDRYHIQWGKKKGLSLPYEFLQQVLAKTDWQPKPAPISVSGDGAVTSKPSPRPKRSPLRARLSQNANFDTLIAEDLVNHHWLPMEVQFVADAGAAETFDIEVEGDHEFIANGLLVHNSAGMRQGDSKDEIFAVAKDNLWQQGEDGNWRIDPERDALRMSNHTRVFHRKPTLDEVVAAVRKQFYSGEGAIQWAGETVARANRDLISTPELKRDFIAAYDRGEGKEWLEKRHPELEPRELEHRLARVGLNPCVTADTWVHTEFGPRQVKELVGVQHGTFVNGELFATTKAGFFQTGVQQVFKLTTDEGFSVRLTGNHKVLKVTSQTPRLQYTEWVAASELKAGDRVCLHNHREIQPWSGEGSFEEGWLLGSGGITGERSVIRGSQRSATALATRRNASCQQITSAMEKSGYGFYCGFLKGLFEADGSVGDSSVRLRQNSLAQLEAVQRMLLRLGIASEIQQNELIIANDNLVYFQQLIGFQNLVRSMQLSSLCHRHKAGTPQEFRFTATVDKLTPDSTEPVYDCTVPGPARFDANGLVVHNCGEIIGSDFHCNLSEIHLNQIDPNNHKEQEEAFTAGALSVATLLNHKFVVPRYRYSREQDPIVGVSFTGLFDFFVKAFGVEWLQWLAEGRPHTARGLDFLEREAGYLSRWREIVHRAVWDYCDRHGMKRPNRCTTVQPSGTKSLLTNASPGWHPPFGLRWVRRITFAKNDPVALACLDYGYSVVPGQSDKDENGNLLKAPFDDRVKEWLVEIPVEVSWIDLPGVEEIAIEKFTATTMFDYYMQVQKHWTTHNSSATVLLGEDEIEPLGERIYEAIRDDEGYISAALLARFDAPFHRLPFERISREKYEEMRGSMLRRQKSNNFSELLNARVLESMLPEMGPQDAACSGMTCELKG